MDNEVDANVATMSLGELVSHSMVLPMYGASAESVTGEQAEANRSIYAADTPREIIEAIRPGGVLLLDRIAFHPRFGDLPLASVVSPAQLTEYTEELQSVARSAGLANLLIVTDQEGGRVNRLPTPPLPSASSALLPPPKPERVGPPKGSPNIMGRPRCVVVRRERRVRSGRRHRRRQQCDR